MLKQLSLHDAGPAAFLGPKAVKIVVQIYLQGPGIQNPLQKFPNDLKEVNANNIS